MILEGLERMAGGCIRIMKESCFFKRFSHLPPDYERATRQKVSWQKTLASRRRVLLWHENNRWRNLGRAIFRWFLQGSLGSVGVSFLLMGAFSLAGCWIWGRPSLLSARFLSSAVLFLCAVPLLGSRESCGYGIRKGRLLGGLLLGFCKLPETLFETEKTGKKRWGWSLLLGVIGGLAAILFHPVYVLLALGVPILFALLLSVPELALLCVLAGLPFCNLAMHPTGVLFLGLAFCGVAWLGKATSGKRQTDFGRVDLCVALFALTFLFGGLFSWGGRESLWTGGMRAALLLLSWFPARGLLSSSSWRSRCVSALLLSAFFVSLYGIWQYVMGKAELAWVDLTRFSDIGGRVCSVFKNPNMLAVFLLLTLPISLGEAWGAQSFGRRVWMWTVFFAEGLCLVFTWSRGAWLGGIVAVLLFFLFHSARSLALLFLSPIPTLSAALYLPRAVLHRFLGIAGISDSSARYRLYTWRGALRMIRARPFGIGVGDAAYHAVYPLYAVSGTERVMHAHQLFLQIAIETGLPSLLLFLFILYRLARRVAAFLANTEYAVARARVLGSAVALVGGLIMGLFDCIWYHPALFALFWIVAALLFADTEKGGAR